MTKAFIDVKFRIDSQIRHRLRPALHRGPARNAVIPPHTAIGRGIIRGVIRVTRVLNHRGARARKIRFAEPARAIGRKGRGHPAARRTAPKRIAGSIHLEFLRVGEDEGNGPGEILHRGAATRPIDQSEGVVAFLGDLEGMGKAIMHRPDVDEAASCIANRELRPGIAAEKEEARVSFVVIGRLLFLAIDIKEDTLPGRSAGMEGIHDLHRLIGVDVGIPSQAQVPQRVPAIVALVHGEQKAPVVSKGGVFFDIIDLA